MFDFRILGVLEIGHGTTVVRPTASKQRRLLAALLLNADRVVSLNRLIDVLWEHDPPRSAVANVRTYAMSLRRLLVDADEPDRERLVTSPEGYMLRVTGDDLDAATFTRLVEQGRTALADRDTRAAVGHLGRALRLWRHDHAGVGISRCGPLAQWFRALEEQRLQTVDEYLDARLKLGIDADLVEEIRRAVAESPLRERRRRQLMLALYGLGDTAGALRCFDEARAALADGLGIDPGPELQRLHRDILNHDPALPAPTKTVRPSVFHGRPPAADPTDGDRTAAGIGSAAAERVPRHLPPRPALLIGRHRELDTVVAAFEHPPPADHPLVAVVSGPVGTGKSALAVSAASLLAPAFPDGQLYVDLSAPEPHPGGRTAGHLATLLRCLGDPAADLRSGTAAGCCRLRSLLADQRILLVLDNATDAAEVRPLLPATSANGVIVTSRRVLTTLDVAVSVRLGPLPACDALALLGRLVGDDQVAAAPAAAAEVVRSCGHLPLAIRIAAARLLRRSEWSLFDLAARLRRATGVLDEFAADDLSLRERLLQVYRELDPAAAAAFVLYGTRRLTDATPEVVAEALGLPVPAAVVALDELVDAQLAVPATTDAYRVLEFPARLAAELAAAS